jgi:hypothetical protein
MVFIGREVEVEAEDRSGVIHGAKTEPRSHGRKFRPASFVRCEDTKTSTVFLSLISLILTTVPRGRGTAR